MIYILRLLAWLTRNKLHIAIAGPQGLVLVAGDKIKEPVITPTGIHFRYDEWGKQHSQYGVVLGTARSVIACPLDATPVPEPDTADQSARLAEAMGYLEQIRVWAESIVCEKPSDKQSVPVHACETCKHQDIRQVLDSEHPDGGGNAYPCAVCLIRGCVVSRAMGDHWEAMEPAPDTAGRRTVTFAQDGTYEPMPFSIPTERVVELENIIKSMGGECAPKDTAEGLLREIEPVLSSLSVPGKNPPQLLDMAEDLAFRARKLLDAGRKRAVKK
jgi:hypothetical protein